MTNTRTRTRLRASNRHMLAHAPSKYARSAAQSLRRNYGSVASKTRRGYRRAQRVIRDHPGMSAAIMAVGIGLMAGMILGFTTRSRWLPQRVPLWPY